MFTIDAHLDLSMNALEWNRDLRQTVSDIRAREHGLFDKPDRGNGTVSLPELRRGNVGLVVATLIARYVAPGNPLPGWHSPQQAWAQTQGQLAWYKTMEAEGEMTMITTATQLKQHVAQWQGSHKNHKPIGYILSLEGADSLVTIEYLQKAYDYGLRAVGAAHYGVGRYANGTNSTGHLSAEGKSLLRKMGELNMILDATHLCDDAFWDSLQLYTGPIWASHNNCRQLVNHNRQFSNEMIQALVERGAVIGCAFDAWMLVPNWVRQQSLPKEMACSLQSVVNHIDHICQLIGNTLHVGIGSDLDGAFGKEQCPHDLDTIADLTKLHPLLKQKGYNNQDVENILHGNWYRFLLNALP